MADPIRDVMAREIDEELRREQLLKLWDKYGTYVLAAVVLVVLGVAGWKIYENRVFQANRVASTQYLVALTEFGAKRSSEAQKTLEDLATRLKEITEDIAGIVGKTPGLRGQLLSELTYLKLHEDEMAYLAPQLNARRVEAQVLDRRIRYLKDRRKELYAALGIERDDDGR